MFDTDITDEVLFEMQAQAFEMMLCAEELQAELDQWTDD